MPRLSASRTQIFVADINTAVVDAIRRDGGYQVSILEPDQSRSQEVEIAAAYAIGRDDRELDNVIREIDTITTSVQVPNLPPLLKRLEAAWSSAPSKPRRVVGCENLHHIGHHISGLMKGNAATHVRAPNCVVDRICATLSDGIAVEAESYTEWVIEGERVNGADFADDVDRLFFRKRYLVNSVADSAAFLGLQRGYTYLHEAIGDAAILEELGPLIALLMVHLERAFGFSAAELDAYRRLSVRRLGNPLISRRLETVARDPWRKFGPAERFMEPILAEAASEQDIGHALFVVARLIRSVESDPQLASQRLAAIWKNTAAESALPQLLSLLVAIS